MTRPLALAAWLTLLGVAAAQTPAPPPLAVTPEWPLDEVTLFNGVTFRGRLVEETAQGVTFQAVYRAPGRPTFTWTTAFGTKEVAAVKRLPAAEREALRARLALLDPNDNGLRKRMEELELAPAAWLGTPAAAKRYASERFVLVSSAPDATTRRAAVRLEQIFAAYARFLPPQAAADRPTTVLLAGTLADYRKLAEPLLGADAVQNLALYDPARDQVVCGSDLSRLDGELAQARGFHARERQRLDRYEADARQLYKNARPDLERMLATVERERARVRKADRDNDAQFDRAVQQLFAILYHEAFHAYVAKSAYPARTVAEVRAGGPPGELPRWLNEGLAQIFETALFEADELRVGHADAARLERVQALLRPGGAGLVPLKQLLGAGRDRFVPAHASGRASADRVYLTAWAAATYLTFERRLVGGREFPAYLRAVNGGGDPEAAFAEWVGQDAAAFEAQWHDYLTRLRADGSVARR